MNERMKDAVRGVLWEQKWRGTLEESSGANELEAVRLLDWGGPVPAPASSLAAPKGGKIGLGTYGWDYGPAIVEEALAEGVPLIDTAETYGYGRVETALGKVLSKHVGRRQSWIATKVARNHLSQKATYQAALRSRDRLQISSIDLYQVHWPDPTRQYERTLDALAALTEHGVIRYIGVCNFSFPQLCRFQSLAVSRGLSVWSNQIRVNQNDPGATGYLIPQCRRLGIRVIAYSPLGQGTLKKKPEEALTWLLPRVDYAIPRTNSVLHLRANLRMARL